MHLPKPIAGAANGVGNAAIDWRVQVAIAAVVLVPAAYLWITGQPLTQEHGNAVLIVLSFIFGVGVGAGVKVRPG